jgi:homocysteine S-methyltransferase
MTRLDQLDLAGLEILDGGMATELERRGCNLASPLWSARAIFDAPEIVAAVHRDYLEAGADCLLTASYQVSAEVFLADGLSSSDADSRAAAALHGAVRIAGEARDSYCAQHSRKVWIAASLGPYGAALHNGAEYHGNYDCSFEALTAFHARRLAVLKETPADFAAFETIPSAEEARAVVRALRQFPEIGACISFTCRDSKRVAHGEELAECVRILEEEPQAIAVGINCTHPRFVPTLIGEAAAVTSKPIAVYPNSGEGWDAERRCWTGAGEAANFGGMALTWRAAGADWIGGCCRTGPEEIRAVAQTLRRK